MAAKSQGCLALLSVDSLGLKELLGDVPSFPESPPLRWCLRPLWTIHLPRFLPHPPARVLKNLKPLHLAPDRKQKRLIYFCNTKLNNGSQWPICGTSDFSVLQALELQAGKMCEPGVFWPLQAPFPLHLLGPHQTASHSHTPPTPRPPPDYK